jgi:hypothetical protein
MWTNMFSNDAQQQALGFLVAQTTYIEPGVYRIKYPDLNYRELVPIDSAAPEWAKSVTFFSVDMVGRADWFSHLANDVPLADITRDKHESAIEMAACGYRYTTEELQQAMMVPNVNLGPERAAAAKRAAEEFVHNTALYGASAKNWFGLINNPMPVVMNVAGGTWATKAGAVNTISQIMQDVNGVLSNIYQTSQTVEMADTLLLPLNAMNLLSMTQLPNTTMNIMEWIAKNNMYTQQTGQALTIRGVRGLDTAGAAGQARMIAYRRDPDIIKLHIPMPHRFLEVWRTGPMVYDIPGIFRLGGLEIRRPGAIRFVDGI